MTTDPILAIVTHVNAMSSAIKGHTSKLKYVTSQFTPLAKRIKCVPKEWSAREAVAAGKSKNKLKIRGS